MDLSLDSLHFLIFLLPGFVLVWTYRHYRKVPSKSDFEYLALSSVWGIVFFATIAILGKYYSSVNSVFDNNYTAALFLIVLAFAVGWLISQLTEMYKDPAVKKFIMKIWK